MEDSFSSKHESYTKISNEISAHLAQIAKQPPELLEYLRAHGTVVKRGLQPVGLAYYVYTAPQFQRVLTDNLKSLDLDLHPEQEAAFLRVLEKVSLDKKTFVVPAGEVPVGLLHGQTIADAPAPHKLPVFNQSSYTQYFVPILLGDKVMGVLQIWFSLEPKDALKGALEQACLDAELYFKSRQVDQVSQELARIYSYSGLLESLSGDFDLNSLSKKLLDYAHQASGAERVSLFVAKDYQQSIADAVAPVFSHYTFSSAVGLQCPGSKSEESKSMESLVHSLLLQSLKQQAERAESSAQLQGGSSLPEKDAKQILPAPPGQRMPLTVQWAKRDEVGTDTEPAPEVLHYFDLAPMNWATVLPLYDESNRICGALLLEGKQPNDSVGRALLKMQSLMYSGGHALSTALFWSDRWMLQWAQRWINWKDGTLNTPKKRKTGRWVSFALILLGVLLFPVRFHIKAPAQIRPQEVLQMPAQTVARIVDVMVREGAYVDQGSLLVQLDTRELEYELSRYESEYLQFLTESDRLLEEGDEGGMQAARLQAEKAYAQLESVRYQLDKSTMRAPFSGLILGPKNLEQKQGQVSQVGETLIEIARPDTWEVRIQLTEQNLVFLESLLKKRGAVDGKLKLVADPSIAYPIQISKEEDLAYGLDISGEDYFFDAIVPLSVDPSMQELLKAGFGGRAAFYVGWRPFAYVLLREAVLSVKVNWF